MHASIYGEGPESSVIQTLHVSVLVWDNQVGNPEQSHTMIIAQYSMPNCISKIYNLSYWPEGMHRW